MSMRATFTTEFIYDGAEGFMERYAAMCDIFMIPVEIRQRNIVGQIAGITKGSSLSEEDIYRWLSEQCYELSKITIVPFKIVWIFEGGDVIFKEIKPNSNL